jgi:hypothetical protein
MQQRKIQHIGGMIKADKTQRIQPQESIFVSTLVPDSFWQVLQNIWPL